MQCLETIDIKDNTGGCGSEEDIGYGIYVLICLRYLHVCGYIGMVNLQAVYCGLKNTSAEGLPKTLIFPQNFGQK